MQDVPSTYKKTLSLGKQEFTKTLLKAILEDTDDNNREMAPNDTEVWQTTEQIVSTPPTPRNGGPIYFLGKPAMQTSWMAGTAPHKSG